MNKKEQLNTASSNIAESPCNIAFKTEGNCQIPEDMKEAISFIMDRAKETAAKEFTATFVMQANCKVIY